MIDLSKIITADQKAQNAAQQAQDQRIAELKQLLRETDHVALSDYDQDKPEIKMQRQEWRVEIRQLQGTQQ